MIRLEAPNKLSVVDANGLYLGTLEAYRLQELASEGYVDGLRIRATATRRGRGSAAHCRQRR